MALPIFGKYMEQIYANPTMEYGRGHFKKPNIEMTIDLDCDNMPGDESGENGEEQEEMPEPDLF
jgi:penicillin-binding protein 1A